MNRHLFTQAQSAGKRGFDMKLQQVLPAVVVAALLLWCLPGPAAADFDRDQCYNKCRRTPGPMVRLFGDDFQRRASFEDDCMQECDRKFWKDFDEKTGDTDKKAE